MVVTTPRGGAAEDSGAGEQLRSSAAAEALLLEVVQRHAEELMRIARMHSLCADDAHDAYQRSLEQFLRHGRRLRRQTAAGWLFTVCKREAIAVRRARGELVGAVEFDADRLEARHDASPEDRAVAADAVSRSAEALQALKPQELRALWLRADGRSYAEIQEATGWSYTKVNRCLTEGRRRFLARCAALEAGADCERWAQALAAVAGGEAGAEELALLRPHLRRCAGCRATLRGLHASSASMATVLPPGLLAAGAAGAPGGGERLAAAGRWLARLPEALAGPVQERATAGAVKWQAALEVAAGGKVAAVAASTVALAGGGAVVAGEAARPDRPATTAEARSASTRTTAAAVDRQRPASVVAPVHVGARPRRATTATAPMADAPRASRPVPPAGAAGRREFGVAPTPVVAEDEFGLGADRAPRPTAARPRARARSVAPASRSVSATSEPGASSGPSAPAAQAPPTGTDFAPAARTEFALTAPATTPVVRASPATPAAGEFGP